MSKFYCAVKIGAANEAKVNEYLENFREQKAFDRLTLASLDRLHVTTAFLGEIPEAQAIRVLSAARIQAPFDAFLGEVAAFGASVLLLRAYGSGLTVLNHKHASEYEAALGRKLSNGYKYVPHLTLAKNETNADASYDINVGIRSLCNSPMMPFTVEKVGLYCKSDLVAEVALQGLQGLASATL